MGTKLFLSGICVFVLPGTSAQVVVALCVALGSLHMTTHYRPFVEPSDNGERECAPPSAARSPHRLSCAAVAVAALWAEVVALLGVLLVRIKELHVHLVREPHASALLRFDLSHAALPGFRWACTRQAPLEARRCPACCWTASRLIVSSPRS